MRSTARMLGLWATIAIAVLIASACGGGEATATPPASPTSPPRPTATGAAAPTATQPRGPVATATAAPAATRPPVATATAPLPTPTPALSAPPTPVNVAGGKRGGTLTSRSLFQPIRWDTWEGFSDIHTLAPMFNNLILVDPYGDGKAIAGDAASGWTLSADGKVITFSLNKGIKFHDGAPLTSKDVAYAFDRGWKPRSPNAVYFKSFFSVIQNIETPDDFTVKVTLSAASNAFIQGLALAAFQLYPASLPFPGKLNDWKAAPYGTGPFKWKSLTPGSKMEYVRNPDYWKTPFPYLDALEIIQLTPDATLSAFRTGRLDVTNLDTGVIANFIPDLKKATGFNARPITVALRGIQFNQRAPWTDPRVREAIDLAFDRRGYVDSALQGIGSIYASPLMPPEIGGSWGISTEVMKQRPGFNQSTRAQDTARAKQLLTDAGVDPSKITVNHIGSSQLRTEMEVGGTYLIALGFKVDTQPLETAELSTRAQNRNFDIYMPFTGTISIDDPLDVPAQLNRTPGPLNYGKWSDPALDDAFLAQDQTLDVAKRKQMIIDIQNRILNLRWHLGVAWTQSYVGSQPWVKNFNPHLPFLFQQQFRHEQVWLENKP